MDQFFHMTKFVCKNDFAAIHTDWNRAMIWHYIEKFLYYEKVTWRVYKNEINKIALIKISFILKSLNYNFAFKINYHNYKSAFIKG